MVANGWHVLLSTNEERNVRFYRRLGFRVARDAAVVRIGELSYTEWWMVRPPVLHGS